MFTHKISRDFNSSILSEFTFENVSQVFSFSLSHILLLEWDADSVSRSTTEKNVASFHSQEWILPFYQCLFIDLIQLNRCNWSYGAPLSAQNPQIFVDSDNFWPRQNKQEPDLFILLIWIVPLKSVEILLWIT